MEGGHADNALPQTARATVNCRVLPGEALEVHYLLANVYSNSKRLSEAEAELAECLRIDSDNAAVNNDLGYLLADQNKKLAEAEAASIVIRVTVR